VNTPFYPKTGIRPFLNLVCNRCRRMSAAQGLSFEPAGNTETELSTLSVPDSPGRNVFNVPSSSLAQYTKRRFG
jgi:hypothetical protein